MVELGRREAKSSAVSQECSRTHPFWRLHALYTGFALPLPSALFVPGSMCLVPKQYRQNLSFTPISTAFLATGNFRHPPRAGSTCVGISICSIFILVEGSLEVKRPTIWKDERQRWEESEKRRAEERRSKKRKSQKREDPGARKGRKVAKHCVFPMICGSGGSKSRLAKAAGKEPAGQMRDEKLHAVVA